MTVEWLIHLLQQQDLHAEVFLWSERHDLRADIIRGGDPCLSPIEEVKVFPGDRFVCLIEHDDRNYF